jgi:hypothetical protein
MTESRFRQTLESSRSQYQGRPNGEQWIPRGSTLVPQPQLEIPTQYDAPRHHGAIAILVNTCGRWGVSYSDIPILLGYKDNPQVGQSILDGIVAPQTQDVLDRVSYVLSISMGLGSLFNDEAKLEQRWLNTPHKMLASKTPLSFVLEGPMANLIAVDNLVRHERGL